MQRGCKRHRERVSCGPVVMAPIIFGIFSLALTLRTQMTLFSLGGSDVPWQWGQWVIPVGTMVEAAAIEAKVGEAVVVVFGEVEMKVVIVLRA